MEMLNNLKENPEQDLVADKENQHPNLPLEFTISTVLILKAMLSLKEAK